MTCRLVLEEGVKALKRAGIFEPEENAWILYEFVFETDRAHDFLHREEEASEEKVLRYRELLAERSRHVPVQYLTGFAWFMGRKFFVNKDVLIPRQDTETLVEEALREAERDRLFFPEILDLCAGSGCIGIGLVKGLESRGLRPALTAADLSREALAVARRNGDYHKVACEYVRSDLFSELKGRRYDYILSNPPYIRTAEIDTLMEEVRDYEPELALDGGEDGLFFYRKIAEESGAHLKEGGRIFLEIGYDQGEAVKKLLAGKGFREVSVIRDLSGNPRVVKARRSEIL